MKELKHQLKHERKEVDEKIDELKKYDYEELRKKAMI